MIKIIVLLFASALGFGVAAHAADSDTNATVNQVQVKKLRAQADKAHKKGDALTAQADKLESGANAKSGEKMRGGGVKSIGQMTSELGAPEKRCDRCEANATGAKTISR